MLTERCRLATLPCHLCDPCCIYVQVRELICSILPTTAPLRALACGQVPHVPLIAMLPTFSAFFPDLPRVAEG